MPPQINSSNRLIFERPLNTDFERFYAINADAATNLFNPKGAMSFETAENAFNEMVTHWNEKGFGT